MSVTVNHSTLRLNPNHTCTFHLFFKVINNIRCTISPRSRNTACLTAGLSGNISRMVCSSSEDTCGSEMNFLMRSRPTRGMSCGRIAVRPLWMSSINLHSKSCSASFLKKDNMGKLPLDRQRTSMLCGYVFCRPHKCPST